MMYTIDVAGKDGKIAIGTMVLEDDQDKVNVEVELIDQEAEDSQMDITGIIGDILSSMKNQEKITLIVPDNVAPRVLQCLKLKRNGLGNTEAMEKLCDLSWLERDGVDGKGWKESFKRLWLGVKGFEGFITVLSARKLYQWQLKAAVGTKLEDYDKKEIKFSGGISEDNKLSCVENTMLSGEFVVSVRKFKTRTGETKIQAFVPRTVRVDEIINGESVRHRITTAEATKKLGSIEGANDSYSQTLNNLFMHLKVAEALPRTKTLKNISSNIFTNKRVNE